MQSNELKLWSFSCFFQFTPKSFSIRDGKKKIQLTHHTFKSLKIKEIPTGDEHNSFEYFFVIVGSFVSKNFVAVLVVCSIVKIIRGRSLALKVVRMLVNKWITKYFHKTNSILICNKMCSMPIITFKIMLAFILANYLYYWRSTTIRNISNNFLWTNDRNRFEESDDQKKKRKQNTQFKRANERSGRS